MSDRPAGSGREEMGSESPRFLTRLGRTEATPESSAPEPVRPPTERYAAISVAILLVLLSLGLIVFLRVRTWTLVLPFLTLAFALEHPNSPRASMRDAFLLLGLFTIPFAQLAKPNWPLPMRIALNSPGTAAVVLLVIAVLYGDGVGAGVRERSLSRLVIGLRESWRASSNLVSALVSVGVVMYVLSRPDVPSAFVGVPIAFALAELLSTRFVAASGLMLSAGAFGVATGLLGAALGYWSWSVFFLSLSISLPSEVRKIWNPGSPEGGNALPSAWTPGSA